MLPCSPTWQITQDCILSSELPMYCKPEPEIYETAVEFLGLMTDEMIIVAAHIHDVEAA